MEDKTGGQAFPTPIREHASDGSFLVVDYIPGMTLRDYFAGQAMQALISKLPMFDQKGEYGEMVTQKGMDIILIGVANSAFGYADAMIKERKKVVYK